MSSIDIEHAKQLSLKYSSNQNRLMHNQALTRYWIFVGFVVLTVLSALSVWWR